MAILALLLRFLSWAGVSDAVSDYVREGILDGSILTASINFELGGHGENADLSGSPEISPTPSAGPDFVPSPAPATPYLEHSTPPEIESPPPADMPGIVPTTITGGLTISNATSFDVDIPALMAEQMDVSLPSADPQILIIHTHGSEAYTPDGADRYSVSDGSRTLDKEFNVIRVGDELCAALEANGLNVIHDRGIYDYPSYSGSYGRSAAAIESYLSEYPEIAIVIDLHRDALGSGDTIYKTVANIDGEKSSQLMLLVGTGENGLSHPHWQENLKLALYLQSAVIDKHKTLARAVALKSERYNQQLTCGSLILEVGSAGNTLQEALCAVRLFADAISEPLKALVA